MYYEFLLENAEEILALTEDKTRDIARRSTLLRTARNGAAYFL